ncbi:MAG: hypothetical protein IJK06_12870 [Clostridia bacterium]|nr:hypothetical protein [Clostridia bacterium]MBR0515129.1 hypothetical protein [Clostridia bacterium]
MLKITVTENTDQIKKRSKCLKYLQTHRVDVGLTSGASARSKFLLAIHTRGSPVMRIPPRPVVRPALARETLRAEMAECLMEACEAANNGDLSGTQAGLENAGQRGAEGIREYIDAGIDPPNSPVTLSGGWIYNRVAKKGVLVKGKTGDKPLLDTGALYNDFDYEVTER